VREAIRQGNIERSGEVCGGLDKDEVAGEVGDLLFTAVNLARKLGVDPELALRRTTNKFRRRFAAMERSSDLPLEERSPSDLEALWVEAKDAEAEFAAEPAG
jgi:uncharacterized protein YabN with tetrapyrrole methylase and pyrophosphatase domain